MIIARKKIAPVADCIKSSLSLMVANMQGNIPRLKHGRGAVGISSKPAPAGLDNFLEPQPQTRAIGADGEYRPSRGNKSRPP